MYKQQSDTFSRFHAPKLTAARTFLLAATTACLLAVAPQAASAASFVVGTTSDDDTLRTCSAVSSVNCSLHGAILEANDASGADVITFVAPGSISIDVPLPDVTDDLTIDAQGQAVVVVGSGSYSCAGSDYALDITAASASPTYVLGLAINAVCGRAIRSNVPAPSIRVGPRHSNNTVAISGAAGSATSVQIFRVLGAAVSGEASQFFQQIGAAGGNYSYVPAPTPNSGEQFTAIGSGASGSSNFSPSTATPSDLASPAMISSVGNSNDSVRIDFTESIAPGTANPAAFALTIAGVSRPIIGTLASGNSVYLYSNQRWATGEAGSVALTGVGRVTDFAGNEVLGEPNTAVFAGPGELTAPTISNFRFAPQKMCARKTRVCKRNYTYAYISLNKDSRVIFKVYRGTNSRRREIVTFIRRLKAGRNKIKVTSTINGRNLPASTLSLRAVAQDVARTNSAPADALFRLVKHKRFL